MNTSTDTTTTIFDGQTITHPVKDVNGHPFSLELSPWSQQRWLYELSTIPPDRFALPGVVAIAIGDQYRDARMATVHWLTHDKDQMGGLARQQNWCTTRLIADDPILYDRMAFYAKHGRAPQDWEIIKAGDWTIGPMGYAACTIHRCASIQSTGIELVCHFYPQQIWRCPVVSDFRRATNDEIKAHLASSTSSACAAAPASAKPANPANFVIDTGGDMNLIKAIGNLLASYGLFDPHRTPSRFAHVARRHQGDWQPRLYWGDYVTAHSGWDKLPQYPAATQFGEIVRLLSLSEKEWDAPPVPKLVAPVVHGYTAVYDPDGFTVTFGCAQLHLRMLRVIHNDFMTKQLANRSVASITLDSGKTLTREQIADILDYVGAVNKAATDLA